MAVDGRFSEDPGENPFDVLPELVLVQIVSSFPLVDVISWATVSKRWRYLWRMVPNLVFDKDLGAEQHIRFVEKILSLRCSMMKIERLWLPLYGELTDAGVVDRWIDAASNSTVDDLDLRLDTQRCSIDGYRLPDQIYSGGWYLKKLHLSCISLVIDRSVRWNSLKSLSLSACPGLTNQALVKILEGSPLLELMELKSVSGFDCIQSKTLKKLVLDNYSYSDDCRLTIIAPHLQSLFYRGRNVPLLLNCSSLVDAHLHFDPTDGGGGDGDHSNCVCLQRHKMCLELFESLRCVENLSIDTWFLQVMSKWKAIHFPSLLPNCKSLTLKTGLMKWEIPAIGNLLQRVPYLETLVINLFDAPRQCGSCYIEENYTLLQNLDASLDHLKLVNFHSTLEQLVEVDLDVIGSILKNAYGLQKIFFYPHNCPPLTCRHCDGPRCDIYDGMLAAMARLAYFPRVSMYAKMYFYYDEEGLGAPPDEDEETAST